MFWGRLLIGGEGNGGGANGLDPVVGPEDWESGEALIWGMLVWDFVRRFVAGLERGEGDATGVSCGESSELMSIVSELPVRWHSAYG